ncbi:hypothetical protein [Vreelandella aquamarina]|uniref:hypothetical protein n=1 Tax=Vreelandella aquamarina TaxID=77097 RepID=UPI003850C45C
MRKIILSASVLALGLAAGTANADNNRLFIEQVGDNNFLGANQDGTNNETYAVQNGNFNSGGASTDVGPGTNNNNQVLLKQDGNRNIGAWSFQSGTLGFGNNTIGIVQETNQNFAGLSNQDGPTTNSQIFIKQTGGNGNYVGNGASVSSNSGNSASNGSTVGFTNPGVDISLVEGSSVYSLPTSGDSNGRIHGDGNAVGVIQSGAANALAINVVGNNNRVGGAGTLGVMTGPVSLNEFTDSGNYFSDSPTVDPTGVFTLDGIASQDGNNNTGVIAITGNSNAVSFSQAGNNNVNEVYVSGTGNLAVANQY